MKNQTADDATNEEEKKQERGNLRVSKELMYYIVVVFILGMSGGYGGYLPLIASQMGIRDNSIFYIFSSSTFFSAILAITGGVAIDRFNKKKLFQVDIIILLVILLLYASGNKAVFIMAIVISGLATALDNVMNAYVFENFSEEEVNKFWGVIGGINLVSFSLGTFLSGVIYEWNYSYLFTFAIALNIVGFILSIKLKDVEKNHSGSKS